MKSPSVFVCERLYVIGSSEHFHNVMAGSLSNSAVCDRGEGAKCRPGQRAADDDFVPKLVEGLHGKHIVDVSVGPSRVLAVTKTGAVYSWACNELVTLAQHDSVSADVVARPSRVNTPTVASGCHISVHCGPSQVRCLLTVT